MEKPEKIVRPGITEHLSEHFFQRITPIQLLRSRRALDLWQINLVIPQIAADFPDRRLCHQQGN